MGIRDHVCEILEGGKMHLKIEKKNMDSVD